MMGNEIHLKVLQGTQQHIWPSLPSDQLHAHLLQPLLHRLYPAARLHHLLCPAAQTIPHWRRLAQGGALPLQQHGGNDIIAVCQGGLLQR